MAVPTPLDGTKARIEIREFPGGAVIALRGDHDLSTRPQLLEAFRSLPRNPWSVVVIDLRQCTFVDSTIIGAILTARRGDSRRVAERLGCDARRYELCLPCALDHRAARPRAGSRFDRSRSGCTACRRLARISGAVRISVRGWFEARVHRA